MVGQISLLLLLSDVGFLVAAAWWRADDDKNLLSETVNWLKGLDRGYAYKERSRNVVRLNGLVKQSYKELHCGYAFFALLHMHYTKDYLTKPEKLSALSDRQVETGVVFTGESATMLAVMYENSDDNEWDGIAEIAWLFHMYAEMAAEFVRKYRSDENKPDEYAVVDAHGAVDMLLADFIRSNNCMASDPETPGQPINISSSSLYKNVDASQDEHPGLRRALENRQRFWRQYRHNGDRYLTGDDPGRFSGEKLRLNHVIDDKKSLDGLRTAFGGQLDWDPILESLERTYRDTRKPYGRLTIVVDKLIKFQNDFVDLLKAIALRIAAKHLLYVGRAAADVKLYVSSLRIYVYNRRMARLLTDLADHIGLNDDGHLNRVIGMMTDTFVDGSQTEERVREILGYLQDVSTRFGNGVRLAEDVAVDEGLDEQSTNAIKRVVSDYSLGPYYLTEWTFAPNSLLCAEAFVGFVRKITHLVDFQVINWFGLLKESKVFDNFIGMESWFISYPKNVLFGED